MTRVLITGASGMLGACLVASWSSLYSVYATGHHDFTSNPATNFVECDLVTSDLKKLMSWAQPEVIVHCAAQTNVDYCEANSEKAYAINAMVCGQLRAAAPDARIICISTDAVYGNGSKPSAEHYPLHPISVYGRTKLIEETLVVGQAAGHLSCVVRTTLVGTNLNSNRQSLAEWIVESLKNHKSISLFQDAMFSPISIWDLADQLVWVIENRDCHGTFNIAGSEPVSKYGFGLALAIKLGLDISLIESGKIKNVSFVAPRVEDATLDSTKFQQVSDRILPELTSTIDCLSSHFEQ